MRNELETLEMIANYLRDNLSAFDRTEFEKRIQTDEAIRKEFEIQRDIMNGIKRLALKAAVTKGKQIHHRNRILKIVSVGVTALVVISAIVWFATRQSQESSVMQSDALPEIESIAFPEAENALPLQEFMIDAKRDTIIETSGGIVFAIPEGCFDTDEKNVRVEVREALLPSDIMKAGLTTLSNGELLETEGMFFIQAKVGDREVSLKKEIIAEIPTNEIKQGMQLYDGEKGPKNEINWVNPKPMETFLNNVDVLALDFYPPGYINKLQQMKLDYRNRIYTDSLFYAMELDSTFSAPKETEETISENDYFIGENGQSKLKLDKKQNTASGITRDYFKTTIQYNELFLKPSQIRTIWNTSYNGSLVATTEFEERIAFMYKSCTGNPILKMYLDNMHEPLWKLDSIAARMSEQTTKAFTALSRKREGRVRPNEPLFEKLKHYYEKHQKQFAEAALLARRNYLANERAQQNKAMLKQIKHNNAFNNEARNLYQEELKMNFDEACRQLGYSTFSSPYVSRYTARINSTGWKNLDRALSYSTLTRTTLDYTDRYTGKKAKIEYSQSTISVDNSENFEAIYVYLLPDKFNSYIRMERSDSSFSYSLNELLSYEMVAIGYRGYETSICHLDKVNPGEKHIELENMSAEKTKALFESISKKTGTSQFAKEVDYVISESLEVKRKASFEMREQQRADVMRVVYPCMTLVENTSSSSRPVKASSK